MNINLCICQFFFGVLHTFQKATKDMQSIQYLSITHIQVVLINVGQNEMKKKFCLDTNHIDVLSGQRFCNFVD